MKELFNIASELNSNKSDEVVKLAALLQQKIYLCSEIILQFQSWLDDIQSLEVINGLDKKLKNLHSHIKNEVSKLDVLQVLVKDYFKTQAGDSALNREIQKNLENEIKRLAESKNETTKKLDEIYSILFNKRNLLNSLSEHV